MAVDKDLEQSKLQSIYPSDAELTPFTLNVLKLESILFRVEMELDRPVVEVPRLNILMSEASSLREELFAQKDRAVAAAGISDGNVQRFVQLLPTFNRLATKIVDVALYGKVAMRSNSSGPPDVPTDNALKNGDDENMEKRVEKLESELASIKLDIGIIKANGATKSDIAETKAVVSEAKSTIILWVVTAIVLAQILPGLLKKFGFF